MDTLYKLQLACFVFMLMNALILGLTRLHVRWINRKYEESRWVMLVSMLLMAAQYFFQMHYGIRASGDDAGAVFNILFYAPCFVLYAVGVYNIVAIKRRTLRFVSGNIILYVLNLAVFAFASRQGGGMHIGMWIYVMIALFFMSVLHSISIVLREMHKRKRILESETAMDLVPYVRYSRSSITVLFMSAFVVPFAILSSKALIVVGPLLLFAVLFFVVTFISLGYNWTPAEALVEQDEQDGQAAADDPGEQGVEKQASVEERPCREASLSAERMKEIEARVGEWCEHGGFKDSDVNMQSLSNTLKVPKSHLSIYFEEGLHCTFRVWLSDMRFKAAQDMMIENPGYSNDIISAECGFSSRSYLYRVFKERVGMTPTEWRARQEKS